MAGSKRKTISRKKTNPKVSALISRNAALGWVVLIFLSFLGYRVYSYIKYISPDLKKIDEIKNNINTINSQLTNIFNIAKTPDSELRTQTQREIKKFICSLNPPKDGEIKYDTAKDAFTFVKAMQEKTSKDIAEAAVSKIARPFVGGPRILETEQVETLLIKDISDNYINLFGWGLKDNALSDLGDTANFLKFVESKPAINRGNLQRVLLNPRICSIVGLCKNLRSLN